MIHFLFAFLLGATATQPRVDRPIEVLFIGNSLTYYNEMPWMVGQLAAARGVRVHAAFEGRSGATLKQQWEHGRARTRIHEQRWDWVVLQDQSTAPVIQPDELREYAAHFAAEVRASGAKPLLFLTWAHAGQPSAQAALTRAYRQTGAALRVPVAPVGIVWDRLRTRMQLFDGSGVHPNVTGTYLAACVFFAVITGQSPLGLPHRFDVQYDIVEAYRASLEHDRIEAVDAEVIQRAVAEEVRKGK
jgi:hypothetical protein